MSSTPDPFKDYFDSDEPRQELDSPFLNEEYLVEETEVASAWENRLNRFQLESPFLEAFEEGWRTIDESEVEEFSSEFDEEIEDQLPEATKPVLSLDKLKIDGLPEITLALGSSGQYEGFFREPPSSHNGEIKISGRVQIEEAGTQRGYDYTRDHERWPLGKAWANVGVGGAISSSGAGFSPVKRNGSFTTSTWIGYEPYLVRRLAIQVIMESKNGKRFGSKVVVELIDLAGFLAIVDPKEKTRPSRQTHLEFLASVRKIYFGAPKDPFEGLFNLILYRHRNVRPIFDLDTAEGMRLRLYKILYANGEWLEIGHVLCGIEGSPKQKPDKDQNLPKILRPELIMTWAGDLGSVIQERYIKDFWNAVDKGISLDLNDYLVREASRSDLIGDIDGINIGSNYDSSRSLAENLNAYYGKKSRRRYHEFIANSKNERGMAELPLVPGKKPPKLSMQARQTIAFHIHKYLNYFWTMGLLYSGTDPSKRKLVDDIVQIGSPEIGTVADYFVRFLEDGLALEQRQGAISQPELEEFLDGSDEEAFEEHELVLQADQEKTESLDDEGALLREDETKLKSPEDLEELYSYGHEYELDQGKDLAELKETENLESNSSSLDWQMKDSGEEESEIDEEELVEVELQTPAQGAKKSSLHSVPTKDIFMHVYFKQLSRSYTRQQFFDWIVDQSPGDMGPNRFDLAGLAIDLITNSSTAVSDFKGSLKVAGSVVVYFGHTVLGLKTTLGLTPYDPAKKKPDITCADLTNLLNAAKAKIVVLAGCATSQCVTKIKGDTVVIVTQSGKDRVTNTLEWAPAIKALLDELLAGSTVGDALDAANKSFAKASSTDSFKMINGDPTLKTI